MIAAIRPSARTRAGLPDWMASAGASLSSVGAGIKRYARQHAAPNGVPAQAADKAAAAAAAPVSGSARETASSVPAAGPASAISKAESASGKRAAAFYVGNSCTALRSICNQFAGEVAKERIAQVTSDANGYRQPSGLKLRLRYKF